MNSLRILRAALAVVTLMACATQATLALAQDTVSTESFDDPGLSRWEHSPNAVVADGTLHIEPDGFAFHPARWSDMSLVVHVRCPGEEAAVVSRWLQAEAGSPPSGEPRKVLTRRVSTPQRRGAQRMLDATRTRWHPSHIVGAADQSRK